MFPVLVLVTAGRPAHAARVAAMTIEGVIGVATQDYVKRALRVAEAQGDQCLIIRINTPGGLLEPTIQITQALLNAPLPTVVWVTPKGASATSAGLFITAAASFAAMDPTSSLGASHPVMGVPIPSPPPTPSPEQKGEKKAPEAPPTSVEMQKAVNYLLAHMRAIAEKRHRNYDWIKEAILQSETATADEAVRLRVVDFLASDMRELLDKLEGRTTPVGGRTVILHTRGAVVDEIPPSARDQFLQLLSDPNILLALIVIGALGIIFELQSPGAILPGVVGGICALLAMYSMAILPVRWAGVALILFAIGLFIADVKVPSHGFLTAGGIISFIVGALMLVETQYSQILQVSWLTIVSLTVLVAGFFIFAIGAAVRAHRRKVTTGREGMIGERGRARSALTPEGSVFVAGEIWRARAAEGAPISEGEAVEVMGLDGFTLLVRRSSPAARG